MRHPFYRKSSINKRRMSGSSNWWEGCYQMPIVSNRRSSMTLYSDPASIYSHQVRFAIAEKGIGIEIIDVNPKDLPEEAIDPYYPNTFPVLVDRDLRLCKPQIIMEYLDERYPHPPLMPIDPVSRAQARLYLYRIDQDWYRPIGRILSNNPQIASSARKELRDSLINSVSIFEFKPFFMSEEISLVDCVVVPLLWRLSWLGIELPAQSKAIKLYATRLFLREAFRRSLSDIEEEMHVPSN